MIAELKPYEDYTETEQTWLGEIPSHWELSRLGARLFERRETNENNEIQDVLSVMKGRGVIPYAEKGNVGNKRSDDIRRYKIVRPNDIVINCMNVIIGSLGISKYTGCLSPVYYVLRTRFSDDVPRYFNAVFQSPNFHRSLVRIGNGILAHRMRIPMEKLKCEMIPIPPPDEQELIVRFLDWASVRLGKAIAAKRKVIGLLEEQKQAIIHRAVTRGLDDTVPLKPSGQVWIEKYPAHWQLKPNRSLMHIRKELVGAKAIEYKVLSLTKRGVIVRDMDAGGKYLSFLDRAQVVRHGDLVFCLFDVDETPRAVGRSKFEGMISPDYTVMECTDPLTASFLECFYIAIDDRKMLRPLYTGLRKRISKPLFRAAKTPIPPESEINAILSYITTATSELDRSSDCLSRQIKYVQEYRTRLIADVVTGKLDVREFARTLPVDIAEDAAELASSELGDDEFSDSNDELADELAGEPA